MVPPSWTVKRQDNNPSPMTTSGYEIMLREAAGSADALAAGLTSLRAANILERGRYYCGLHLVSIGLERLLKLILLLNYEDSHGNLPPDRKYLKDQGHRIVELMAAVRRINQERGFGVKETALDDTLAAVILNNLSDFATFARYHNLDSLCATPPPDDVEPLARWGREVHGEILARHFRPGKRAADMVAFGQHIDARGGSVVWHHREDGSLIDSVQDLVREGVTIETKQRYTCYYLSGIIVACVEILRAIEWNRKEQSDLREFYLTFLTYPGKKVLSKKRWDVYRP